MIYQILLSAAVVWLIIPRLNGQETPPTLHAEVRMLAFTPDLQFPEAYAQDPAAAANTAVSVPAPIKTYLNHQFSTVLFKSRKIIFTTKPDRASLTREGETIGEVIVPAGVDSAILLFLPGKAGDKIRTRIMVINDAKRAFPSGSYHATNLSHLPIRLILEQKNFDFKPGAELLIEDPPVHAGHQSSMHTFAFMDDVWKPIATGLWSHPGQARGLLVLFQNPASGNVELRAFDDDPPREPKPAPKPGT